MPGKIASPAWNTGETSQSIISSDIPVRNRDDDGDHGVYAAESAVTA